MFKNYLRVAFRNLYKNKMYSLVNIIGLTIGITSCLLIGIYITHELRYDRFHVNADRIVRVTMDYSFGDEAVTVATTGTKVGPQFKRIFPEIEAYTRTLKIARAVKYEDKLFEEKNFFYADSAFLGTFFFPLQAGDPVTALNTPDKILVTPATARKYFGTADPLGKVLRVGENKDFIVTGVIAEAPTNSQIQYDFVASFTSQNASKREQWNEANYITYLLLHEKTDIAALQKRISAYMKEVSQKELSLSGNGYLTYHIEPLGRIHLHSSLQGFEPNNNITYIYILGIIALLVLSIASVNYMNLATAQSAGRTAEIGIRKVLGAKKGQIFKQFIGESLFLAAVAIIFTLLIARLILPFFNQLSGKEFQPSVILHPVSVIALLILGSIVALVAGSYPALVLSNLKLIKILKAGFSFSSGSSALRKSLIVFQFVISIFLIICTIIIVQQLSFIKNKDLGYNKEQLVVLPLDNKMRPGYDDLKKRLLNQQGVQSVGAAYEEPTDIGWGDGIIIGTASNQSNELSVNAIPVDEDFIKTMGMKIIAGSDYTQTDIQQFDTTDNDRNLKYTFILNETAVKTIGWKPEEAIGKILAKGREGTVKGVVKDFHFKSMHEPISPLVIFLDKRSTQKIFIKIDGKNVESTLQRLEKIWKESVSHRPFEYHFLDEDYEALYETEQRTAAIFTSFSTLAIVLACLGLFALTAYSVVQRTKEIGIRKILGATIGNIVSLLSKEFVLLVLLAILIATPLAWLAANKWLQDFTYRIDLKWWVFVLAGMITVLIALLTVSFQAIKAALTNPVKNLRTE
ncbi:MAG TPA: FtsX-like permease family protein [Flavitalea sp.]|nr:FtsX-like permease family protein [Flavitalea sp.]